MSEVTDIIFKILDHNVRDCVIDFNTTVQNTRYFFDPLYVRVHTGRCLASSKSEYSKNPFQSNLPTPKPCEHAAAGSADAMIRPLTRDLSTFRRSLQAPKVLPTHSARPFPRSPATRLPRQGSRALQLRERGPWSQ